MAKYFKNVQSLDDLKKQFRELLKKHHPDNGGDVEIMKEVNVEFDALFPIWKNKTEKETGETIKETAEGTRSKFYTQFGWEGMNHDWKRTLKEVAQIVRAYVKEKYPTYKFSVRTAYASMCQELHVDLKESPIEIYKTFDEMTQDDINEIIRKANNNNYWTLNSWYPEEAKAEIERIWKEHGNFFRVLNEATQAVIEDVDAFVNSYNYSDCDGMTDYFDVDFYYFGCARNNGIDIKIVPKTARIKNAERKPATKAKKPETAEQPEQLEVKTGYTYKITKGEDTRDGSELWLVRIEESQTREQYLAESKAMKERGGYYSKFRHAFIFRDDPAEKLTA